MTLDMVLELPSLAFFAEDEFTDDDEDLVDDPFKEGNDDTVEPEEGGDDDMM